MQQNTDTDIHLRELDAMCVNESRLQHKWYHNLKYLAIGILFGIVFVKSEVVSWFRIQEMFRLQSFHMYGIIGVAVTTGLIGIQLIALCPAAGAMDQGPHQVVGAQHARHFGQAAGGGGCHEHAPAARWLVDAHRVPHPRRHPAHPMRRQRPGAGAGAHADQSAFQVEELAALMPVPVLLSKRQHAVEHHRNQRRPVRVVEALEQGFVQGSVPLHWLILDMN